MKLSNEELLNIKGGEGSTIGIIAGIGAAIAFFIGVFDGFFNPKRCEI